MRLNNIFNNIPKDIPDELFEELTVGDNIKIERIISKGHSSPESGWYDQENNEWVMVLKGEASLTMINANGLEENITLVAGDYLNIPAHQKHKVSWTHPTLETIWLAVHY
ncbi:cupin domain-containing protein [Aliikangiella coralliicola]|uniref:Cupin domain-containing protein n=1 Tax=Aliikangiella coralliicola TaxID=2592383 RepID=A0A545UHZ7_9GAMM|nr:cupin domain-containing protein [Aliikangiella coralliicola]TQV89079.1 cupin domain-containing protein [Aliikangiella coralliicola]